MPDAGARKVFLTGATGFIGGHLLDRLVRCRRNRITCLTRRPRVASDGRDGRVTWITGDLRKPDTYADALDGTDVVMHLAAATGAASAEALRDVNVAGTQALLAAARDAEAGTIVYVSSIAVTGHDIADYPYAQSKLAAEEAVRECGLDYVIVRPTIVLGEAAPNWRALGALARLPVVPVIGRGTAQVQPVDVIDVAKGLELLVTHPLESGSIVDLGGPEVLSFSDFLARIRAACGRSGFPHLSIPVAPVRMVLKTIERILGARAPVGPGQVAPFVNDGVAQPNPVFERLRPDMLPLDTLFKRILLAEQRR